MGHSADKHTLSDEVSETKYFLNTGRSKPFARKFSVLRFLSVFVSFPSNLLLAQIEELLWLEAEHEGTLRPTN